MPNQPKTVAHTVRVETDLWATARTTAGTRGETISDVVRRALTEYVRDANSINTDHASQTRVDALVRARKLAEKRGTTLESMVREAITKTIER